MINKEQKQEKKLNYSFHLVCVIISLLNKQHNQPIFIVSFAPLLFYQTPPILDQPLPPPVLTHCHHYSLPLTAMVQTSPPKPHHPQQGPLPHVSTDTKAVHLSCRLWVGPVQIPQRGCLHGGRGKKNRVTRGVNAVATAAAARNEPPVG
jgi:hypothetical protein